MKHCNSFQQSIKVIQPRRINTNSIKMGSSSPMKKSIRKRNSKSSCHFIGSGILFLLPILMDENHLQYTNKKKVNKKLSRNPGKYEASKKTLATQSVASKTKIHIKRIPKIGCTIPSLIELLTNISNSGAVPMDQRQLMDAVNKVDKLKRGIDEGVKWNGTVELSENLKIKLYKSGLVLWYKK